MFLNPVPTGRKPRDFYRIHRRAICRILNLTERLPQNDRELKWHNIRMYNVPLEWVVGMDRVIPNFDYGLETRGREMGQPKQPISQEACFIGELDVRLLKFTPSYYMGKRTKSSSQRLEVMCPCCFKWVPFSRLTQHMHVSDGKGGWKRSKTCSKGKYKPIAERRTKEGS